MTHARIAGVFALACLSLPTTALGKCSFGKMGGFYGIGGVDAFQNGSMHVKINKIGDGLLDLLNPDPWVYIQNYDGRKHRIKFHEYTDAVRDCTGDKSTYPDWFYDPTVGTKLSADRFA